MSLYRYTGSGVEVFPSLVVEGGVLVAEPGMVIELAEDPNHSRLEPVQSAGTTVPVAATAAESASDDVPSPDPIPVAPAAAFTATPAPQE